MQTQLWKHKTKHKGKVFFANYEYSKGAKRIVKMRNVLTGKELSLGYTSIEAVKKAGWVKV